MTTRCFWANTDDPLYLSYHDLEWGVLEWLAAMCSHVPNKGEQMVRYYGYYSNKNRGLVKRPLS